MEKKLIDMHIHTIYSDGDKTPLEIYEMAKSKKMKAFAITDHDSIVGSRTIENMQLDDIIFINGIEISCEVDKGQLHILGYDLELTNKCLNNKLDELMLNSYKNLKSVLEQLLKDNSQILFDEEDINQMLSLNKSVSVVDLAQLLVKYNYCINTNEAFDKYIVSAYGKIRKETTHLNYKEAIELILNSGGIPVLAHNNKLKLNDEELDLFVKKLVECGLIGIEAFHSSFNATDVINSLVLSDKYNLLISGGSDYHGESVKPDIELGTGKENNLKIKQLSLVDYVQKRKHC